MNSSRDMGEGALLEIPDQFPWRAVAVVSVMLMEMSLVVPWLWLIARSLDPAPLSVLIGWFLIFGLAARGLYRLLDKNHIRSGVSVLVSGVVLIIGLLVSLNFVSGSRGLLDLRGALQSALLSLPSLYPMAPELPIMVLVIIIWRRGVAAASSTVLEPGRTGFKFRIGVLILIALAVASPDKSQVSFAIPAFFISSLLAMSLTRADHLSKLRGASDPPFGFQWLLSLMALFLLVLLSGLAIGGLMASDIAYQTLQGLRNALVSVLGFLYRLSLPLLAALEPFFQNLIGQFRRFFLNLEGVEPENLADPAGAAGQLEGIQPPDFFQRINDFLASLQPYWPLVRTLLISLVFVLLLVSAIRVIQRRSRQYSGRDRSPVEGEGLAAEFRLDLRHRFDRWRQELSSWGQAMVSGQLSTAILVRRLYGRLLSLADSYGRSRYRWETPLEFQEALARLFPEAKDEIRVLTDAYVAVRYGELPETNELVAQVRHAWSQIYNEYR